MDSFKDRINSNFVLASMTGSTLTSKFFRNIYGNLWFKLL